MPTQHSDLYHSGPFELGGCGNDLVLGRDELSRRLEREQREKADAQIHLARLSSEAQQLRAQRDEALRALDMANQNAVFQLAKAAEEKDGEAGQHMRRIGVIAGMIAEAIGCSEHFCELICDAAQLHDIGKIGIHESILSKPGALTIDEWKLVREHSRIGAGILSAFKSPVMDLAAEISMSHHEHYSGAGYPLGLVGEAIPLAGRIVGLADFFDSLTMDRCYRKAVSDDQALAMIAERRGEQFDPRIVDAFLCIADQVILARDSINEIEAICDLPDIHGDWWMAF